MTAPATTSMTTTPTTTTPTTTAPTTALVTFIGRTEANRAYKTAHYRFEDGSSSESSLFAAAMLANFRATGRMPKRLVAIGTPTSGWDVLIELVARLAPESVDDALQWAIPVSQALERGPVPESALREFEERFSARLGLEVQLRIAANNGDSVFAVLASALEPRSSVILDITHSFRSMPVHALVALGALRWLKEIEIADILYGSLDERSADGSCAARSLRDTARLAHATPALAQLTLVGDVGGVAEIFEGRDSALASRLRNTQQLEALMQYGKAATPRGQALGTLRTLEQQSQSSVERACAQRTGKALELLHKGVGAQGLRNRAEAALDRGDLMRALGLANEALLVRVVELHKLRDKAQAEYNDAPGYDRDYYRILNRLAREALKSHTTDPAAPGRPACSAFKLFNKLSAVRNAVMHAGCEATGQPIPDELMSEKALIELLRWSFDFFDFLNTRPAQASST